MRFGLRYVITGAPAGAPVDIRFVTRFPEVGLFDPGAKVWHHESVYIVRGAIGAPAYREFMFDHRWEIVPGEWNFEFWHAGRYIGSQNFCVLDAEFARRHPGPTACGFLVGRMEIDKPIAPRAGGGL